MKKTLQFGSLALAIVMLASLCACNSRDEPQSSNELLTSAPTQVSAEEPTVFATEETEPPTEALADMTEQMPPKPLGWIFRKLNAYTALLCGPLICAKQSAGTVEKLPEQQQSHRQEKPPRHQSPAEVHQSRPDPGPSPAPPGSCLG